MDAFSLLVVVHLRRTKSSTTVTLGAAHWFAVVRCFVGVIQWALRLLLRLLLLLLLLFWLDPVRRDRDGWLVAAVTLRCGCILAVVDGSDDDDDNNDGGAAQVPPLLVVVVAFVVAALAAA
jgi:hypothetical protein